MARPRGNGRLFVVAGLLVGLALALLVSPHASSAPDGLERVAEGEGFGDAADDHQLAGSPLADYAVEGVDDEGLSTGLSGVVGVLLTFGLGVAVFALVRTLRPDTDEDGSAGSDEQRTPA